jgi:hypothetical protein
MLTQRPGKNNTLDIVTDMESEIDILHHVQTGFFMDPFEKDVHVSVYEAWNAMIECVPMYMKPTNDEALTRFNQLIYVCVLNQYINGDDTDGRPVEAPELLRKMLFAMIYSVCRTSTGNSETAFLQDQVALLSDEDYPYQDALAAIAFKEDLQASHHVCSAILNFGDEVERYCIETFRRINVDELLHTDDESYNSEMTDRENKARLKKFYALTQKYEKDANDIYAKTPHFPIDLYFQSKQVIKSPVVHPTASIRSSLVFANLRALANSRTRTELKKLTRDKNISNQIRDFIKVCTLEDLNGAFQSLAPKTINKEDPGKRPKFLSDPAVLEMYVEAILHEDFVSGPICHALAALCVEVNLKFKGMPQLANDDFDQTGHSTEALSARVSGDVGGGQMGGGDEMTPMLRQPPHNLAMGFDDTFEEDGELRLQQFSEDREVDMLYRRAFKFEDEETKTSYLPLAIGAAVLVLFIVIQSK